MDKQRYTLFSYGTPRVIPSGEDNAILSVRVANYIYWIWFILPAHEAS